MSVAYVPQASFLNPQPFNPPDNLSDVSDGLNPSLKNCLIEKYLKQLGKNELLGERSPSRPRFDQYQKMWCQRINPLI
jgi:hypothetical protein